MSHRFLVRVPDDPLKRRHLVEYMRLIGVEFAYLNINHKVDDLLGDYGDVLWDINNPYHISYSDQEIQLLKENSLVDTIVANTCSICKDYASKWKLSMQGGSIILAPVEIIPGGVYKCYGCGGDHYSILVKGQDVCIEPHKSYTYLTPKIIGDLKERISLV